MPDPVLFQFWRSSASWRVRWALALKGVACEIVTVDLPSRQHEQAEHLARNPMGRVPALLIDGHYLAESVAIIEYLEERYPSPRLYPSELLARARVRQIIELINSGIQPFQTAAVTRRHAADEAAQRAWILDWNHRGLAALEALLESTDRESGTLGPFAYGPTLTAADLFLVPQAKFARRYEIDLARYPRVHQAEQAALATPLAQATLPEKQPGAPAA